MADFAGGGIIRLPLILHGLFFSVSATPKKRWETFPPAKLPGLMSALAHTVIQATNRMADPRAAPNRQAKAAVMMVCIVCLRYIVTMQAN